MYNIILNLNIVVDKLKSACVISHNATDLSSSKKNVFRFFTFKEIYNCLLIFEIQLFEDTPKKIGKTPICNLRQIAEPTMPLWPATYIFEVGFNDYVPKLIVYDNFTIQKELILTSKAVSKI